MLNSRTFEVQHCGCSVRQALQASVVLHALIPALQHDAHCRVVHAAHPFTQFPQFHAAMTPCQTQHKRPSPVATLVHESFSFLSLRAQACSTKRYRSWTWPNRSTQWLRSYSSQKRPLQAAAHHMIPAVFYVGAKRPSHAATSTHPPLTVSLNVEC